jgi:hypothetical protein
VRAIATHLVRTVGHASVSVEPVAVEVHATIRLLAVHPWAFCTVTIGPERRVEKTSVVEHSFEHVEKVEPSARA